MPQRSMITQNGNEANASAAVGTTLAGVALEGV